MAVPARPDDQKVGVLQQASAMTGIADSVATTTLGKHNKLA